MNKDNSLSAVQIASEIGKTSRTIQRALESLKLKGLIKRVGANKNGYWEITK